MQEFRNTYKKGDKAHPCHETESALELQAIQLVDRAAGGDIEAFGDLYSIYVEQIYRYVFFKVGNRMIAEDITEDIFVKAWKSIKSCRGRGNTFPAWLYRIAHNQTIDDLRRRKKEGLKVEIEELVDTVSTESSVEKSLEWQKLSQLIATLPENQGNVVIMKFIEGRDNREIGNILGKSEGAVRVLQTRALYALRQKLSGDN